MSEDFESINLTAGVAPVLRFAVISVHQVAAANGGWPFRLVNDAKCAVTLVACCPDSDAVVENPVIARTIVVEPELHLGTVDELVALYRAKLETIEAAAKSDLGTKNLVEVTHATFDGVESGVVRPLFAGAIPQ